MVSTEAKPAPGLWELGAEYRHLQSTIARLAEGLDDPDPSAQQQAIAALEGALEAESQSKSTLERKADAYCYVIQTYRANAEYRKSEAKRLAELSKESERKADRMQKALLDVLTRLQPEARAFSLPQHEIKSLNTKSVEISDAGLVPSDLQRVNTTIEPDKVAIKKRLQAGEDVAGAALAHTRTWRIC